MYYVPLIQTVNWHEKEERRSRFPPFHWMYSVAFNWFNEWSSPCPERVERVSLKSFQAVKEQTEQRSGQLSFSFFQWWPQPPESVVVRCTLTISFSPIVLLTKFKKRYPNDDDDDCDDEESFDAKDDEGWVGKGNRSFSSRSEEKGFSIGSSDGSPIQLSNLKWSAKFKVNEFASLILIVMIVILVRTESLRPAVVISFLQFPSPQTAFLGSRRWMAVTIPIMLIVALHGDSESPLWKMMPNQEFFCRSEYFHSWMSAIWSGLLRLVLRSLQFIPNSHRLNRAILSFFQSYFSTVGFDDYDQCCFSLLSSCSVIFLTWSNNSLLILNIYRRHKKGKARLDPRNKRHVALLFHSFSHPFITSFFQSESESDWLWWSSSSN